MSSTHNIYLTKYAMDNHITLDNINHVIKLVTEKIYKDSIVRSDYIELQLRFKTSESRLMDYLDKIKRLINLHQLKSEEWASVNMVQNLLNIDDIKPDQAYLDKQRDDRDHKKKTNLKRKIDQVNDDSNDETQWRPSSSRQSDLNEVYNSLSKAELIDLINKRSRNYFVVVIDTETTGLLNNDSIWNFAYCIYYNDQLVYEHDGYYKLKDPTKTNYSYYYRLMYRSNELYIINQDNSIITKPAQSISDLCDEIRFLNDINLPTIGHNVNFDIRMLNSYLPYHPQIKICTLSLARSIKRMGYIKPKNCQLSTLAKLFDIETNDSHLALNDIYTTYHLYLLLRRFIKD